MIMEAWPVWAVIAGATLLAWAAYLVGMRRGRASLEDRALRRALGTKVRHVMTRPVMFVREDTSVEDAARVMYGRNIGCLPVVDRQGRLTGIATESDLTGIRAPLRRSAGALGNVGDRVRIEGVEEAYEEIRSRPVAEVMTRHVITATKGEPLSDVVIRMMDHDLHHMPVVDAGIPVGVVARHDLLGLLARRFT
jgi:CBS domain-containing protein